MSTIFIEGFDKYGPAGQTTPTIYELMTAGEWTSIGDVGVSVVAPLSSTGQALQVEGFGEFGVSFSKTLTGSYNRVAGGFRFSAYVPDDSNFQFYAGDWVVGVNTNYQIYISGPGGNLATGGSITQSSIHYLEFDVTSGTSAPYRVYLDGVSLLSGTGNTGSADVTTISFNVANNATATFDDFYLFDTTGSTNNAVLLSNPRIETAFPTSDSQTQFSSGASILGVASSATGSTNAPGANYLFLLPFVAESAATLESVSALVQATSDTANFAAVCYSDNEGVPHTLLSSGTQVTGCTSGSLLTGSLVTPRTLTATATYWIGFITDTSIALSETGGSTGQKASNTYSSGAPSTAPTMTTGQPSWWVYGNLSSPTYNFATVNLNPPVGDTSYVYSGTSGVEDLYTFTALSQTPNAIYTVAVKGNIRNTDTGTGTISLRTKSGSTDTAGSNPGQTPGSSYGWVDSYWDVDPNTEAAWTEEGLNAAVSGVQIAS